MRYALLSRTSSIRSFGRFRSWRSIVEKISMKKIERDIPAVIAADGIITYYSVTSLAA